jgi:hypothetical protein
MRQKEPKSVMTSKVKILIIKFLGLPNERIITKELIIETVLKKYP